MLNEIEMEIILHLWLCKSFCIPNVWVADEGKIWVTFILICVVLDTSTYLFTWACDCL